MKLKFTRKTWYFLLLASAAASMLNGFAVLSGTSFGLIEQIAFAAAGIAALFLAAEKRLGKLGKTQLHRRVRAADGELHGQRLGGLPLLCAGLAAAAQH